MSEIKWQDLSATEQDVLQLIALKKFEQSDPSVEQIMVIGKLSKNKLIVLVAPAFENQGWFYRLTDEGRALVAAADTGVTNACTHTADGSVCAECLGAAADSGGTPDYRAARGIFAPADEPAEVTIRALRAARKGDEMSEKHLFDRVEEVLDLAEFYMPGELGEFPNVTRQTVSDFKKYKSLLEKEAQERQAEIERLRSELAAERQRTISLFHNQAASGIPCARCGGDVVEYAVPNDIWNSVIRAGGEERSDEYLCAACFFDALLQRVVELEASANEAQSARLAAVAEAAAYRQLAELCAVAPNIPTGDAEKFAAIYNRVIGELRLQAQVALALPIGATLLERLAKLEAALKPFTAYATDGLRVTADDWQRAADALKGDDHAH